MLRLLKYELIHEKLNKIFQKIYFLFQMCCTLPQYYYTIIKYCSIHFFSSILNYELQLKVKSIKFVAQESCRLLRYVNEIYQQRIFFYFLFRIYACEFNFRILAISSFRTFFYVKKQNFIFFVH